MLDNLDDGPASGSPFTTSPGTKTMSKYDSVQPQRVMLENRLQDSDDDVDDFISALFAKFSEDGRRTLPGSDDDLSQKAMQCHGTDQSGKR